jgi:predicted rRNA methylase YqxC with S4 and FtsJ domains
VEKCCDAAKTLDCRVVGVVESPITGPAGNVEFLLCARTAIDVPASAPHDRS